MGALKFQGFLRIVNSMEILVTILSILTFYLFGKNYLIERKIQKIKDEVNTDAIKDRLLELSARQLKIKNDVDRTPLDDLVERNGDSKRDNP